jgi:putative ABC transport system permease protein
MVKFFPALIYPMRTLSREPLFSVIVILLLGFGIAANATIFAVIDQVLLGSLPYRDPARVVMLWESNPNQPQPAGSHIPTSRDNFDAWRKESHSFEAMEAYQQTSFNLTGLRNPERLDVAKCTAGFFPMLGIQAKLGRSFLSEDEAPGRNHVVLLSNAFFTNHFQGTDPLGHTLSLNGVPYTIIGVLPRDFHLPNIFQGLFEYKPDLWVPLPPMALSDPPLTSKHRNLLVYARLKSTTSISQAAAELEILAGRRAQEDWTLNSGYSIKVFSLDFENTDPVLRRGLYFLWFAVGLVLLLVCMNLSGLMLLRGASRLKDTAIMAALGASRGDVIKAAMAPGLILALLGALLGIFAAYGGIWLVVALAPGDIHAVERIALNLHGLLLTVLIFGVVISLIAVLPARLTSRGDLNTALKQGASVHTIAKPKSINWSILVSVEVAIALILAIGSTLLVRSFQRLLRVNPGFAAENILTAHLSLPQSRYRAPEDQARFCDRLLQGLRSLPQVESASLIDNMPLYAIRYTAFEIEGRPVAQPGDAPTADYANLTPSFFQTMSIRLRRGRLFTEEDGQDSASKVVILNETLAHKLWPDEDAVGKRIRSLDGGLGPWATVVGVVEDFVQFNVDTPARPELFWPAKRMREMTIALKAKMDPSSASAGMKEKVWEVDKEQPVSDVQTVEQILRHSTSQARFNMWFLTIFAALGILLALVGVYGFISYLVLSRMRDIGIRLALGAQKKHVFFSLIRQTLPFVAIGICLGLGISLIFGKAMRSLIFGITPLDPVTYAIAPTVVFALMLLVVLPPVRKAIRVDPVSVLRQE